MLIAVVAVKAQARDALARLRTQVPELAPWRGECDLLHG